MSALPDPVPKSDSLPPDWRLPRGVDRALWQYLHHETLARDYDRSLRDSPLAGTDIELVFQHADPTRHRLIDLGCGTGRLLEAWEKSGGEGTGVDLSASMLAQARARLAEASKISLVLGNLTDLQALEANQFDRAACLYSTLGMLRPHRARLDALKAFHRVVAPGGKLLLHAHNLWSNWRHPAGRRFLCRNLWFLMRGDRNAGDFINPTHNGIVGLSLHMFTKAELLADLRSASWKPEAVLPLGFDGKVLTAVASSLRAAGWFAIAQKPG